MAKSPSAPAKRKASPVRPDVTRFAHPFYTTVRPAARHIIPGVGRRMTDFVALKLLPIPPPQRTPTMTLAEVIGQQGVAEITKAGAISFHAVGDTGTQSSPQQQMVADAMSADYDIAHPAASPAFWLHLGDVNYYDNTDNGYHAQFYVPYKNYPGKIIAIPGNHDGEIFKWNGAGVGQKRTLEAFMKNFCQPKPGVPSAAGTIYREMISQPGVYWLLQTPFVDVVGLYSNVAENPGFISGPQIGTKQKDWLTATLTGVRTARKTSPRKALMIAVHHPPMSTGSHSSSTAMLADIDDSCTKAGIMPDAVLAAHAHSYQRYTRRITFGGSKMEIPFIVAGSGGRVVQSVGTATGQVEGDHTFDKSLMGYGYLTVTASRQQLALAFTEVDAGNKKKPFDKVVVDLKTNTVK